MKVIILAAGRGSRLDQSGKRLPKPLTQLATHQSILQYQLDTIKLYIPLDHVIVVVGYRKESIMEAFPDLLYVYNPHFAKENTAKSLARALRKVDEDVIWMNGDVIFHRDVLEAVLKENRTGMVVNKAVVGEEEVKYCADEQGKILEVSKTVVHPQGEALGINLFKKEDLPLLKKNLEQCQPNDYFEKAIEKGIQQHQVVWTIPVKADQCTEIDFPEDLIKADHMLQSWQTY